jgi:uncharacterized membrane protein YeiH
MMTDRTTRVVRAADIAGTLVFAIEGALAAANAGLDPIGFMVLGFVTALGGGLIRDLLIGASPPAAVGDWHYAVVVLVAASAIWIARPEADAIPSWLLTTLDAGGLALFAVAGTRKSLDYGLHPVPSLFLGTISGVGGGTMRDVLLTQVPRVLRVDVYATAALAAAAIVVLGHVWRLPSRGTAIIAAAVCFGLRMLAVHYGWQLPKGI